MLVMVLILTLALMDVPGGNSKGLNGTQAMTDLIDYVRSATKDAKVEEEVMVRTSIGCLLFWSDAFL